MADDDRKFNDGAGGAADARTARGPTDRRRPTVARFRFEPDPRKMRELLAQVDGALGERDPLLRRRVRLLIGEIVGRLVGHCPDVAVQLDLELKDDSVRIDIAPMGDDCDFWEVLDTVVFTDLTSGWGRDRRGSGGAWFEVAEVVQPARRPATR
jgi:hypothetical protein